MLVNTESPRPNSNTFASGLTESSRGMSAGCMDTITRASHVDKMIPATPPIADSNRHSVSNWRKMRPRVAPSAVRIPISLWRSSVCARRRPARLAQAISSTAATAPKTINNACLESETISRSSRTRFTPRS